MRPFLRRLPGSRTFSPTALALLIAAVTIIGLGIGAAMRDAGSEPTPLIALDPPAQAAPAPSVPAPAHEVALQPVAEPAPVAVEAPAPVAPVAVVEEDAGPTFNGRPIRKARTMTMLVTAYSPDARSCGKWADGVTASGYSVWTNGMKLVAADTSLLPFGSIITVPGYNGERPVPVLDRGGKIKGHRLDVLYPTHEVARQWGAQRLEVTVWEYAD